MLLIYSCDESFLAASAQELRNQGMTEAEIKKNLPQQGYLWAFTREEACIRYPQAIAELEILLRDGMDWKYDLWQLRHRDKPWYRNYLYTDATIQGLNICKYDLSRE